MAPIAEFQVRETVPPVDAPFAGEESVGTAGIFASPVPLNGISNIGLSGSFDVIVNVVEYGPVARGLKSTSIMQLPPGGMVGVNPMQVPG